MPTINVKWTGVPSSDPTKTPQATNDSFSLNLENFDEYFEILIASLLANDLGGEAKTFYSVDSVTSDGCPIIYDQTAQKLKFSAAHYAALAEGQTSEVTFKYMIRLSNGTLSEATVTLQLAGENDGPTVSGPVIYSLDEDATGSVSLLTNASDVDNGAVLHVANVNGLPTGFTFNPTTNMLEVDAATYDALAEGTPRTVTITYDVVDEHGAKAAQTAEITINGKNDRPEISGAVTASVTEDAIGSANLLLHASDVDDGAVLHVANVVWDDATTPGALPTGFTFNAATNSIDVDAASYDRLASGQPETFKFTYDVVDEHGATVAQTAAITINGVNDAPELVNDTASGDEDSAITTGNVLVNDTDVDTALTATMITAYSQGAHGSVVYNDDGTFTYTPEANYHGTDSFTYTVTDGDYVRTAAINVTINPLNDVPDGGADAYSVAEDQVLTVSAASGVLSNDTDVDGDSLEAVLQDGPTHGQLALNSDGSFSYTPDADYFGTDSFTYRVFDGQAYTDPMTVALSVTPVNDRPLVSLTIPPLPLGATVIEDDPSHVSTTIIVNKSDPDGDDLRYDLVHNGWTHIGGTQYEITGAYGKAVIDTATNAVTYAIDNSQPIINSLSAGQVETDAFFLSVTDGQLGTGFGLNFSIRGHNDAPTVENVALSGDEDAATPIAVVLKGADVDNGDAVTSFKIATLPTNGVLYTDAALTTTYVAGAAIAANGAEEATLYFKPALNYNGTAAFAYTANDGNADSLAALVTITVDAVNDAPVIDFISTVNILENSTAITTVHATDVDSSTIAYSISGGDDASLFEIDANTGALSFIAAPDYEHPTSASGTNAYKVEVKASDDKGDFTTQLVTVNVGDVEENVAPVAQNIFIETNQNSGASIIPQASDANGDALTYVLTSAPPPNTVLMQIGEKFNLLLNAHTFDRLGAGQHTDLSFTYKANDGTLDSNTATVTVRVNGLNDAPTVTASPYGSVTEDDPARTTATVNLNKFDIDQGDTVTYDTTGWTAVVGSSTKFTKNGQYGTATLDTAANAVTYALDPNKANPLNTGEMKTETFGVKVVDNHGLSSGETTVGFNVSGHTDLSPFLLTFDDITAANYSAISDYDGFTFRNWGGIFYGDNYDLNPSGYQNGVVSGHYDAWGYTGYDPSAAATIAPSITRGGAEFDFESGYFTAAWNNDQLLTIYGWRDGQMVATKQVMTQSTGPIFVEMGSAFDSVDRVAFVSSGGVDNPNYPGGGSFTAVDNLLFYV